MGHGYRYRGVQVGVVKTGSQPIFPWGLGYGLAFKARVLHSKDRAFRRLERLTECLGARLGSRVKD